MAKKRIHQIAKELDVASADIVFLANELGFEVKTASSGLTPEQEELLVLAFNEKNTTVDDNEPITEDTHIDETQKDEDIEKVIEKDIEDISIDEDISEAEKEIAIVEVQSGSTPEELSEIINVDATQIVGDLMSFGIMQSMNSELQDDEIEKLLEKYDLIPEVIEKIIDGRIVSFYKDNVLNEQTFCNPEIYEGKVSTMIEEMSGKLGEKIYIKQFSRVEVGS